MNHALLLTDVVDSTKLSEQLGDEATAALWARHDRVARDLLPAHRGREIDKTDGFLLLFETAADAVAYALAYHRAIAELGLKARAGLHVGPVILTENSPADVARGAKPLEVDGLAKPTAARIMGLASGGQTLLSAEARAALGATPLRVESHGHWRMKGVSEPLELFEVGDDDAPFAPPPDAAKVYRVVRDGPHWVPVRQVQHSLPAERDAFVGRSADLKQLARLLDDGARLVSVLGIGGTGKTRLVTHYGWTWLGDWPGGVWFCDLSEARAVDGIVYAVARALDVPLGKDDPVVQLGHAIAGRGRCLVVLDNFEQVARHAEQTLGRWLDRAHEAAFVVTTREVLGLPGETALPLTPLASEDGFDLFAARARQAKPGFVADDVDAVRALVRLLDGLPLAIELAAARVRLMPPRTLLQRMSERFKLLASGGGRHTRQATLRGALDWSWDLLSADEQAALAQLSVFEGGFTLEAVEGVLVLSELWPMDAAQALLDKSLVRQVSGQGEAVRMDLLVSVQEYAAEKLDALGQRADAEARHAAWFGQTGSDDGLVAFSSHGGAALLRALELELDNVVVACRRSEASGAGELAAALLRVAWEVLGMTGPIAQALDLAERVTGMPGLSPGAEAAACTVRGRALFVAGRMLEARDHYLTGLAAARASRPPHGPDLRAESQVLLALGSLHWFLGRIEEAREYLESARKAARESGLEPSRARRFEAFVLGNLGNIHLRHGRTAAALEHLESAVALARESGNARYECIALGNLARLYNEVGRRDLCLEHYQAALAVARAVGARGSEGAILGNLGGVYAEEGLLEEASPCFDAALALAREVGNRHSEGHALTFLGYLRVLQGRLDEARGYFEASLVLARESGSRSSEGSLLGRLGSLHLQQGRPDEARACLDQSERLVREVGEPRDLVQLLGTRARLEALTGDPGAAQAALAEAAEVAASVGATPESEVGRALARARAAVEAP